MLALAALVSLPALADGSLRGHIEFLASADLGGRFIGSEGATKAADYLVSQLEALGAEPLPGEESFKLPFEFTAGVGDGGSWVKTDAATWQGEDSVRALSFSETGEVSGELVFVGYGLVVPQGQEIGYDSYDSLNVEGKIVLALRYVPEDAEQTTRAVLGRYSGLRRKALEARERGARAILFVTGPNSPNAGETIKLSFDAALAGSGIVAASINGEVADRLLAGQNRSLASLQSELDDGNPHVAGFAAGQEVTVSVAVERQTKIGHNVVGYLPATTGAAVEKPIVVLGAHYDHLGAGEHGNSLARKDELGLPHVGADDNASGVSAVLDIAANLKDAERDRGIVVGFWTGEEMGLIGSTRFLDAGLLPMDHVAAYLNFDMVGRAQDNELILQAVGSSPAWKGLIERSNVPVGFDIVLQDDPYLPTDSTGFHQEKVPTLNFFTGSHADYHRPTDGPEAINYEDLERVAQLGRLITAKLVSLAEPPEFSEVELSERREGGDSDAARVFTGTLPDYTSEAEGLLLSGVIEGGPADEAGLQEGDLIVQLGDQAITNVYDYLYALEALKIDVTVKLVFLRDGERIESEITPRARD
jgi:hypothetical protein